MATNGTCHIILGRFGELKKENLQGNTVKEHLNSRSGDTSTSWDTIEACVKDYDGESDKRVAELKKQYEEEKRTLYSGYSGTSVATGSIGAGTAGLVAGIPTGLWLIPKVISWIK